MFDFGQGFLWRFSVCEYIIVMFKWDRGNFRDTFKGGSGSTNTFLLADNRQIPGTSVSGVNICYNNKQSLGWFMLGGNFIRP